MTSVDEVRLMLDSQAGLAPDHTDMVATARARVTTIRRRRRIAGAGAAVALLGMLAPVLLTRPPGGQAGVGTASAPAPYRAPWQVTVDLAATAGYLVHSYGTDARRQFLTARNPDTSSQDYGGDVHVHDPGTFDPAALLAGERVTVQGHPAYYVADLAMSPAATLADRGAQRRMPTVGWADASGAWVTVHSTAGRTSALRVAEAVRRTAARAVTVPFQLSHVPDDLPASVVRSSGTDATTAHALAGFALHRGPTDDAVGGRVPDDVPLSISAQPTASRGWQEIVRDLGAATTTIDGHDAWYLTGPQRRPFVGPALGSALVFTVGSCGVVVQVADRHQITLDEQRRMVQGARFRDCADPGTWISLLT